MYIVPLGAKDLGHFWVCYIRIILKCCHTCNWVLTGYFIPLIADEERNNWWNKITIRELPFFTGRGPSFMMAGHQFFLVSPFCLCEKVLVPPFAFAKKFWSPLCLCQKILVPLCLCQKILVPPLPLRKKFWSPPPLTEHILPHRDYESLPSPSLFTFCNNCMVTELVLP